MNNILIILICISFLCIVYPFFIYPILLLIISFFKKNISYNIKLLDTKNLPNITIVIAAYNEENTITEAINSIFNDGYPHNKIKVLIGIDGKTDNTDLKIKELQKIYPNQIEYKILEHGGKNSVLNQMIPLVATDYYLTMDADMRIQAQTLSHIFSLLLLNENIGAVLANIKKENLDTQQNAGSTGEILYQKFETLLRDRESKIKSTVNAFGFIASRKQEYQKIPNDLMCDDFFAILKTNAMNKNVKFTKDIYVLEVSHQSLGGEVKRRERMVAGSLATIRHFGKLLLPKYGWTSFFLWSHKFIRYFMPIYLIIIAISTLNLEASILKDFLIYFQIIIYSLSILGIIAEKLHISILPLKILSFFFMMNYGFILGIIRFLLGGQNSSWKRN